MGHPLGSDLTLFFLLGVFFLASFNNGSFNYIADKRARKYSYKSNGLLS